MKKWYVAALIGIIGIGAVQAQTLRLMVGANPGAGSDVFARNVAAALQAEGLASSVEVVNRVGATVTRDWVTENKGNPNQLMVVNLSTAAGMRNDDTLFNQLRPIARMVSSPLVMLVRTNSPYQSIGQVVAAMRRDPASVNWGGGGAGGTLNLAALMLTRAIGLEASKLKFTPSAGMGQAIRALVQDQLDIVTVEYAVADEYVRSGQVRLLGIASQDRVPGIDVATLEEQGINVVLSIWTGIVAPPGLSTAENVRLVNMFRRLSTSTAWRNAMQKEFWKPYYLGSYSFRSFMDQERARVNDILGN